MNVLIVEDDESVGRFLDGALSDAGFRTRLVADGAHALREAGARRYDLIVLDLMIPGVPGLEVCRRLRASNNATPILVVTARDTLEDKIQGLDCGADDYLVKPFELGELLARARALLRRAGHAPGSLTVGDLRLDPDSRRASRGDRAVSLSATEYALLELLMRNSGRVLTRRQILDHVWQYHFDGNDSVLDVYISYLRSKIDKGFPQPLIHTVRGIGYCLECSEDR